MKRIVTSIALSAWRSVIPAQHPLHLASFTLCNAICSSPTLDLSALMRWNVAVWRQENSYRLMLLPLRRQLRPCYTCTGRGGQGEDGMLGRPPPGANLASRFKGDGQ